MNIRAHIMSWLSFIVSFVLMTCIIMLSIWIAFRLFYPSSANAYCSFDEVSRFESDSDGFVVSGDLEAEVLRLAPSDGGMLISVDDGLFVNGEHHLDYCGIVVQAGRTASFDSEGAGLGFRMQTYPDFRRFDTTKLADWHERPVTVGDGRLSLWLMNSDIDIRVNPSEPGAKVRIRAGEEQFATKEMSYHAGYGTGSFCAVDEAGGEHELSMYDVIEVDSCSIRAYTIEDRPLGALKAECIVGEGELFIGDMDAASLTGSGSVQYSYARDTTTYESRMQKVELAASGAAEGEERVELYYEGFEGAVATKTGLVSARVRFADGSAKRAELYGQVRSASLSGRDLAPTFESWLAENALVAPLSILTAVLAAMQLVRLPMSKRAERRDP